MIIHICVYAPCEATSTEMVKQVLPFAASCCTDAARPYACFQIFDTPAPRFCFLVTYTRMKFVLIACARVCPGLFEMRVLWLGGRANALSEGRTYSQSGFVCFACRCREMRSLLPTCPPQLSATSLHGETPRIVSLWPRPSSPPP